MKSPKPKSHGAERPERNAETMRYRDILHKTKQLRKIHEVCPECRNVFRENPKHLKRLTISGNQGSREPCKDTGKSVPEKNFPKET